MNKAAKSALLFCIIFSFTVILSGCSIDNDTSEFKLNPEGKNVNVSLSGQVAGSGATSQKNSIDAWKIGYNSYYPNISVAYDPKGSGGGRKDISNGAVVFAATDKKLSDPEIDLSKKACGEYGVIQIPTYISKIEVIFNLADSQGEKVQTLKLDDKTVAAIFSGLITNWSDPVIAAQNPDITLPDRLITVVRRSDDSGTTDTFTKFLSEKDSTLWKWGETSSWPNAIAPFSQGAQSTAGVVNVVSLGSGTIGYAEQAQVGRLGAAQTSTEIMQTSYMVACSAYTDSLSGEFVKSWLDYIVSDDGQTLSHNISNSVPLDEKQMKEAKEQINSIVVNADGKDA